MKIIYPFTHSFLDYPHPVYDCVSISVLGCEHGCKKCHSEQLQNFNFKSKNVIDTTVYELFSLINIFISDLPYRKISFLGGDCLHPKNLGFMKEFLKRYSNDFGIMIYTGYSVEYCKERNVTGFEFLKCGVYDETLSILSEKTDDYIQFASVNQELYDKDYNLLSEKGRYYFNGCKCNSYFGNI